jgi:DNA-binding NtrC family response regulator
MRMNDRKRTAYPFNRHRKKILVVDDEEDLTWSIVRGLSRDSDRFEVVQANSGDMALRLLSRQPFNLMVTDVRMPGLSGTDLVCKVRERFPKVRIILMTAYPTSDLRDFAVRAGAGEPVEKPFEMHALRNLIYANLGESVPTDGHPMLAAAS